MRHTSINFTFRTPHPRRMTQEELQPPTPRNRGASFASVLPSNLLVDSNAAGTSEKLATPRATPDKPAEKLPTPRATPEEKATSGSMSRASSKSKSRNPFFDIFGDGSNNNAEPAEPAEEPKKSTNPFLEDISEEGFTTTPPITTPPTTTPTTTTPKITPKSKPKDPFSTTLFDDLEPEQPNAPQTPKSTHITPQHTPSNSRPTSPIQQANVNSNVPYSQCITTNSPTAFVVMMKANVASNTLLMISSDDILATVTVIE